MNSRPTRKWIGILTLVLKGSPPPPHKTDNAAISHIMKINSAPLQVLFFN